MGKKKGIIKITELADIATQLEEIQGMTTKQLQMRYEEVFGRPTRSKDKKHLAKKISSIIEETAIPKRAEKKKKAKKKVSLTATAKEKAAERDPRIPMPGTVLTRKYKGTVYKAKVLKDAFEYKGKQFKSLSGIARKITGMWWSGFSFWNLNSESE
ncbi:MAG: DUF2924 domain-containing protein [Proteobacteria bacterium]|nr:DUF2924 domain-containing protein [Pseudomonadota bacterium]